VVWRGARNDNALVEFPQKKLLPTEPVRATIWHGVNTNNEVACVNNTNQLRLWYQQPAPTWTDALPIGNGRLGAMVFGGVEHELLQLNEDTLWSGQPPMANPSNAQAALPEIRALIAAGRYAEADERAKALQGPFTQSYLPMADLRIDFAHRGPISNYQRSLDLEQAVASTSYTIGEVSYQREYFVSAPQQVLVVRISASQAGAISLTLGLSSQLRAESQAQHGQIALQGYGPSYVAPSYYRSEEPIIYRDGEGVRFCVQLRVQASGGRMSHTDTQVQIEQADEVLLLLSAATNFERADADLRQSQRNPLQIAAQTLAAAEGIAYTQLHAEHIADYRALFSRVSLDLGSSERSQRPTDQRLSTWQQDQDPQLISLVFQYGRYLLISSSRAGTQAANLQGIWNHHLRAPWSSNYTININTQMNYWPAELTNLSECHEPLFDLIEQLSVNGRETAQVSYGTGGWLAHHNTDLWRQSAQVGDFGNGSAVWACWPMGGAWLCQHLWTRYSYSGDQAFLRERAYPLMRGAAEFCLDWLVEDAEGRLVTAPSTSPENMFLQADGQVASVSAASTMDLAIIRELFGNCIAASQILGNDQDFAQQLQHALDRLPPYQIGARGQLQEWLHDFEEAEPHHRHISHLYGLFPSDQIDIYHTPELAQAAYRTLELRGDLSSGWSMGWKLNVWARLGAADRAYQILSTLMRLVTEQGTSLSGGLYSSLLCAHPPFQIDGNFGASAGIAELLLQSHLGELRLLPALPAAWSSGSVRGLRARGGLEVDLEWRDGQLVHAHVRALGDGSINIRYRGQIIQQLNYHTGESYTING
jgi:alpha-L-fucosidase 2